MTQKTKSTELGFGTFATPNQQRSMNPDGSANVHRLGGPLMSPSDLFHRLTTMKPGRFIGMVSLAYVLANMFFALIYCLCDIRNLGIAPTGNVFRDYLESFFFSTQCFTTVGFGRSSPLNTVTNFVASAEELSGLLFFAIATGLLYGRFSRPRAHLVHSRKMLIAPYHQTGYAAMFRIASTRRHSILIDNNVSFSMGINREENGTLRRRFFELTLEFTQIDFLNLSWTIVHPITADSPLRGLTYDDLVRGRAEFIVLFKAIEETTSQTVLERFSYFMDEVEWGARFVSAIGTNAEGRSLLDLSKIDLFEPATLPPVAGDSVPVNESA